VLVSAGPAAVAGSFRVSRWAGSRRGGPGNGPARARATVRGRRTRPTKTPRQAKTTSSARRPDLAYWSETRERGARPRQRDTGETAVLVHAAHQVFDRIEGQFGSDPVDEGDVDHPSIEIARELE